MTQNNAVILFFIAFVISLFVFCRPATHIEATNNSPYLNHNDTVAYLGSEACRGCHLDKFESFSHTGMGESFGLATPQKSKSIINENTLIFDSINNFYYKPYWQNDSLLVTEFRLDGIDTIYKRTEHIKYIIGSGHHTNSHIYEKNGYLYQAPITFYTQDKIWDFAPGFSDGYNNRFDRFIGQECMTCHNSFCDQPEGAENKYDWVASGIGCERCHGPGEVHVKLKTQGEVIDTSKYVDYSIVNPGKLDRVAQMNVCQRCHIQGIAVLEPDKTHYDFKPGQQLDTFVNVFIPRYDGANTKFIMASQADRLMQSECYKNSEMTCISCHNPHVSTRVTAIETFNAKCMNCHTFDNEVNCTLSIHERNKSDNNCSGCHMPESPSIDIPHVTVTDHLIRVQPTKEEQAEKESFSFLENVLTDKTDPAIMALGYLSFYEKFTPEPALLDSAEYYIKQNSNNLIKKKEALVWLNFIKGNFEAIKKATVPNKFKTKDAWTNYRIGEALKRIDANTEAEKYLKNAIEIEPYNLDFQNKYGALLMKVNKVKAAEEVFNFILQENDQHISALTNQGFVYVSNGKISNGEALYNKALQINPDYIPALLNKVGIAFIKKDKPAAKNILNRILKIDENHTQANTLMKELNRL